VQMRFVESYMGAVRAVSVSPDFWSKLRASKVRFCPQTLN